MSGKTESFETAMEQLELFLSRMSDESVALDESISLYTKAAELIEACHRRLGKAKIQLREIDEKIEKISATEDDA